MISDPTLHLEILRAVLDEVLKDYSSTDFDLAWYLPHRADRQAIMAKYHHYNSDPENFDPKCDYRIVSGIIVKFLFDSYLERSIEIG